MNHHGRWRIGALASAIALLGSLASLEAHAVALGRITVQSALGESLRAEIDISDLSAEEASSLRIGIAGVEVFKAAGLEYSAAAAGLDVKLQRRADGRSYLRLSSNRAITEPFVDLVLEAKWASGRVTRDYTMLFDPPSLRSSSAAIAASTPVLPRTPVTSPDLPPREVAPGPSARPVARPVAAAKAPAPRLPPAEKIAGARQVTVRPGDNASRIAARNKPASVSLDQMLVALLRGNPEAFVGGNINVIKSGAVVDIPDEQAASALTPGEAKQTLIAQSKDFNSFRRKLADGVPATSVGSAERQAGGKVQARVDDRAQASASPDKLTLSKGAIQGKLADEQLARDAASRLADPSKNTSNLNQSGGAAPLTGSAAPGLAVPVAASAATAATAGIPAITATPALAAASASEPGASAPVSATDAGQAALAAASEPVAPASAPAPVAAAVSKPAMVAPPPTLPEPSLIDQILEHSLLVGGGLLLALLAGLGFARYRKTAKEGHVDSSFLDSRLQPDSFFGASGGRRVDTNASNLGGSSIAYSPSQLDAAGDVDPVAEADVYLAYGRDQQAEEILKEALRTYPTRLAIHTKLLEIFAKRRDIKAFESVAVTAFKLTAGQGAEWSYISQLGLELEPSNSLYQSGSESAGSLPSKGRSGLVPLNAIAAQDKPASAPAPKAPPAALDLDLDLGLDFSLDEAPAASKAPVAIAAPVRPAPRSTAEPSAISVMPSAFMNVDDLDLDLNLDDIPVSTPVPASPSVQSPSQPAKASSPEIDFLSGGLDFTPEPYIPPKASVAPPAPVNHDGMLEFDLNSLSLDLGPATKPPVSALMPMEEDPLEIKFLLAEEFRILGDSEGARSLADEVLAKAKGPLRFKAQAFINALS
ncbi:MAG: fimbrial protein FimV [Burkholderiales bacterium]|nr:fimbrial protein FimV [Burkholderiales bacterium]